MYNQNNARKTQLQIYNRSYNDNNIDIKDYKNNNNKINDYNNNRNKKDNDYENSKFNNNDNISLISIILIDLCTKCFII